ncbi:hypothetical protein CXG81DRAFT_16372 [Caulochytrium protostelioides]|uniref:Protein kinase domain-containing protein n=1 Tax=Caulochytrium protostelioides TaxID=1555241 RepID=A0A4P9XF84_9FUNG|nr:hypothetical protein CXG81DRAFT_16372 [Caulochytrium protostelioides]|eukprot:RKP04243.1 hypothetical protein CXG81DRAFT_16372 [Caulochytrium protostelioides]
MPGDALCRGAVGVVGGGGGGVVDCSALEAHKENIRPLVGGRDPKALLASLDPNAKLISHHGRSLKPPTSATMPSATSSPIPAPPPPPPATATATTSMPTSSSSAAASVSTAASQLSQGERIAAETQLKNYKRQLEAQRSQGDALEDDDPLQLHVQTVQWIQQHFPAGHPDLLRILEDACRQFKTDARYTNDQRYVGLWITAAKLTKKSAADMFKYMSVNGIGSYTALYYEEYATFCEVHAKYKSADGIYMLGITRKAQPLARLKRKYQEFQKRMTQRHAADGADPATTIVPRAPPSLASATAAASAVLPPTTAPVRDAPPSMPSRARPRLLPSHPAAPGPARPLATPGLPAAPAAAPLAPASNHPPRSSSSFQVFQDTDGHEGLVQSLGPQANPDLPSAATGASRWTDLGSEEGRTKENARHVAAFRGQRLAPRLPAANPAIALVPTLTAAKHATFDVYCDDDPPHAAPPEEPAPAADGAVAAAASDGRDARGAEPRGTAPSDENAVVRSGTHPGLGGGDARPGPSDALLLPPVIVRPPGVRPLQPKAPPAPDAASADFAASRVLDAKPARSTSHAPSHPDKEKEKPDPSAARANEVFVTALSLVYRDGHEYSFEEVRALLPRYQSRLAAAAEAAAVAATAAAQAAQAAQKAQDTAPAAARIHPRDLASSQPQHHGPEDEEDVEDDRVVCTQPTGSAAMPSTSSAAALRPASPTVMTKAALADVFDMFNGPNDDGGGDADDAPNRTVTRATTSITSVGTPSSATAAVATPLSVAMTLNTSVSMSAQLASVPRSLSPHAHLAHLATMASADADADATISTRVLPRPGPTTAMSIYCDDGGTASLAAAATTPAALTPTPFAAPRAVAAATPTASGMLDVSWRRRPLVAHDDQENVASTPPLSHPTAAATASCTLAPSSPSPLTAAPPSSGLQHRQDPVIDDAPPYRLRGVHVAPHVDPAAHQAAIVACALPPRVQHLPPDEAIDAPISCPCDVSALHKRALPVMLRMPQLRSVGHYVQVRRLIGQGGFARVWEAVCWPTLERPQPRAPPRLAAATADAAAAIADDAAAAPFPVALKVQTPAAPWEYYMMQVVLHRLVSHGVHAAHSVMAPIGFGVLHDTSLLALPLLRHGHLLDLVNRITGARLGARAHGAPLPGAGGMAAKPPARPSAAVLSSTAALLGGGQGAGIDELLAAYYATELIGLVLALHRAQILHNDIKADNVCLRFRDLSHVAGPRSACADGPAPGPGERPPPAGWDARYRRDGTGGWHEKGVLLIDWGKAIDLAAFHPQQRFVLAADAAPDAPADPDGDAATAPPAAKRPRVAATDGMDASIDCWAVRAGANWRYDPDWYGVASVLHILLYGRDMVLVETDAPATGPGLGAAAVPDGSALHRHPTLRLATALKRHWQVDIWRPLFDLLLNFGPRNQQALAAQPRAADHPYPLFGEIEQRHAQLQQWVEASCCKAGKSLRSMLRQAERVMSTDSDI